MVQLMFKTDDGIGLAYEVRGEGIPLILVNGLPDTKEGWSAAAEILARDFRVVTYNLRNQGPVDSGGEYLMDRHVRDLAHLLDHLMIDRIIGVGLSMGARILIDFARANPDRALRLVLIGAGNNRLAPRYRAIFSSWLRALELSPAEDLLPFVEAFVTWALDPASFSGDPDFFRKYAKLLAATHTRRGLGANLRALAKCYEPDHVASLGRPITTRTRFIQGEFDLITPPSFIREMVDLFPQSSLTVIPGCGHNVRVAEPLRLQQEILEFLIGDDELMEGEDEYRGSSH
jgi:pimeloyl-ACP methyl ester carboxylesterase